MYVFSNGNISFLDFENLEYNLVPIINILFNFSLVIIHIKIKFNKELIN